MKKTHRETDFRRTYVGPDVDHQEKKIPAGAAKVDDFGDHGAPAQCRK